MNQASSQPKPYSARFLEFGTTQGASLTRASLLGLYFLMLLVQNVDLFQLPGTDTSLKPFHFVGGGLLIVVLAKGRLPRLPYSYLAFIGLAVLSSAWYLRWGFAALGLNYFFAFLTLVVAASLALRASENSTIRWLRLGTIGLFIGVLAKAVVYRENIAAFLQAPFGHPSVPTFLGGGPNIESSWLAILSALFIGRPRVHLALSALSIGVSVIYASRVGLLLSIFSILLLLIRSAKRSVSKFASTFALALLAAFLMIGAIGDSYLIERFNAIGVDPGSVGRMRLWQSSIAALIEHPWGHGAGNAIVAAENAAGMLLPEDNVHNLLLQWSLDFGILGGLFWVLLLFGVIVGLIRTNLRSPIHAALLLFMIASTLQFRGPEPIFWFLLGLIHAYSGPYTATQLRTPK